MTYRDRYEAIRRDLRELEQTEGVKLPLRPGAIAELELAGYIVDLTTGAIYNFRTGGIVQAPFDSNEVQP